MIVNKICFLIDDDEDDQEIFKLALREVDSTISCISAYNGVDALKKLDQDEFTPHYIFLDVNMPRMNGSQCLEAIKKMEKLKNVPVYMYSTSSDSLVMDETLSLGASAYIIKPSTIGDLTRILSKHLLSA